MLLPSGSLVGWASFRLSEGWISLDGRAAYSSGSATACPLPPPSSAYLGCMPCPGLLESLPYQSKLGTRSPLVLSWGRPEAASRPPLVRKHWCRRPPYPRKIYRDIADSYTDSMSPHVLWMESKEIGCYAALHQFCRLLLRWQLYIPCCKTVPAIILCWDASCAKELLKCILFLARPVSLFWYRLLRGYRTLAIYGMGKIA